jgi:tetratricopeptide (TPR) repeat protein
LSRKPPSSLDYGTLLHELAIERLRRAVVAGDFPRAEATAFELSESSDRFWRWEGLLHLAGARLAMGGGEIALAALDEAARTFPEAPSLGLPAVEIAAHVLLETGRTQAALDVAASARGETLLLLYLRARAALRLSLRSTAEEIARELSRGRRPFGPALAHHLAAELEPGTALENLSAAAERVSGEELASPAPALLLLYALGSQLSERGDPDEALRLFERIAALREAALYWPIPWVRTFHHLAVLHAARGEREGAVAAARRFLDLWGEGDLDRDRVEEARQLVKS